MSSVPLLALPAYITSRGLPLVGLLLSAWRLLLPTVVHSSMLLAAVVAMIPGIYRASTRLPATANVLGLDI